MSPAQAQSDRHRVRLAKQELSCEIAMLAELPREFVALTERSLRLQARVMHLDRSFAAARPGAAGQRRQPALGAIRPRRGGVRRHLTRRDLAASRH